MHHEFTLGAYLRQARARSALSTEDISAGSRIMRRLVDALEADRHDLLPAPVYVRGFIRAGADAEEAIRIYDAQAIPDPPLTVWPSSPPPRSLPAVRPWLRVVAGSLVVAAFGAAALFLLLRRQPAAVAGRGEAPQVTASHTVRPPTPDAPSLPSAPAVRTEPQPVERVLVIRAVETTWVRVVPDGAPPSEQTLAPGAVREWRSAGRFRVTLGNAGGVELELDGQALPRLGERGAVVRNASIPGEARP
jgi:RodZ C-terminal domain/Helix-turn-helix domain